MAWLTIILFCAVLLACVALKLSVIVALVIGLMIFLAYGRFKGVAWAALLRAALEGVKTVKNILLTFVLIGVLTALWRGAGTIAVIVCYAEALIRPPVFLLMSFLLNCGVSVLTGTSFGTAATMGVICATMGAAMGVDVRLTGGAVLAGAFFGDRCSPVSTSALLVAELTHTNIYDNLRRMARTALVPFLLACAIYAVLGKIAAPAGETPDMRALFEREFRLHWVALIPAVVILLLSALRVSVKRAMGASLLAALPVCLGLQGLPPGQLLRMAALGFRAADAGVGEMLNGGGIASMVRVSGIVCLSASYAGIFRITGLLDGVKRSIGALARRTTPFAATAVTALVSGMIACNQTLATMLTHQLCAELTESASDCALDLEDTSIVLSALIPWSIAGAVPLSTLGAPVSAMAFAFYLYLLPLWRLAKSAIQRSAG